MAAASGASSALPVFLCFLLLPAASGLHSDDRECAFTDHLQGAEPHSGPTNDLRGLVRENGTIRCARGSSCYGLWEKRGDGEIHLVKQGCWTHIGDHQECHGDRCLVTATPSQIQNGSYRFCCCSRDLCNANFTEAAPTVDTPAQRLINPNGRDDQQTDHQPLRREETALVALVTVAIAAIFVMALFLGYRMMKGKQKHSLSVLDVMEAANTDSAVDLDDLKLLELIGRGRYGTVYRGRLNERCVAVKLFSSSNWQNYVNERSIYCLPLLQQHDNVARFLAADERMAADGRSEFLILMDFYPHGCLSRYLSVHTVDWLTCCRMTHGVTRGLAFLHTELYRADQYKPAVAHRDVTSRNVLVRADLSCVLADFGLSMKLTGNRSSRHGDDDNVTISEVGTVRYMAPEVLGGALNLRDCEAALKQVDVYALGLLYWESFRRCCDLFPGETVPEHQLAFQAELGVHPSFEDMQMLVAREKYRPRFPEAWKENSLLLRSLKETMEDCWDQDAEARLTAQCAEERLSELTQLSTHTAVQNQRNLSHGRWHLQGGSTPSYIEDVPAGRVKNLQGDRHPALVVKTTANVSEGVEKNRNSINFERQRAQARLLGSDSSVSATGAATPASILTIISESEHTDQAVPGVPVCLQLTEEDLEATKLDPKEVDKNVRESSDENLMERSQKQFGSEPQTTNSLYQQILQTTKTNCSAPNLLGVCGVECPPSSSLLPLPKQQNLPQRPTSLHLLSKNKESTASSSHLKLGKLKSNHRQVETGVAKMNTVTVATAAEPHMVTNYTKNQTGTAVSSSHSAGVPTVMTNGLMGRTNPAGPQLEDGEKMEGGPIAGEETCLTVLNFTPDEHEPLLRREESETLPHPRAGNLLAGRGSNSNNNNNRPPARSDVEIRALEILPESLTPEPQQTSQKSVVCLTTDPPSNTNHRVLCSGPIGAATETATFIHNVAEPKTYPVHPEATRGTDQGFGSIKAPHVLVSEAGGTPGSQAQVLHDGSSASKTDAFDILTHAQKRPATEDPGPAVSSEVAESVNTVEKQNRVSAPKPETTDLTKASATEPGVVQVSAHLRVSEVGRSKVKRPERPCSLDLSSSCVSSDDFSLADNSSLSASGEKIKRRVKTPYTLKKWRPVSWAVSTDTALDPDFDLTASCTRHTHFSGPCRAGGTDAPKINESKSSMAVFLIGGGATATTASESDTMTCF